ncbi:MAG: ABC transporter permease [Gammaproteobacteria bacterium]|nr:MAG: ABC transporter permease [Gammaproteobacteria bacterium]
MTSLSGLDIFIKLGWRNLWLHPLRTLLTAMGLAIGIAALTFLSAMDDGWMQQIKTNFALTLTGHIQIHAKGFEQTRKLATHLQNVDDIVKALNKIPEVNQVVRRLRVSGLASSAGANGSALIYGIEPEGERRMSRLSEFLSQGHWLRKGDPKGAVIGDGLADRLGIGLGDKLVLMAATPKGEITSEVFRVRGLLHSGVLELDNMLALVSLTQTQDWLGMGNGITDIVIRTRDFDSVTLLARELRTRWFDRDLEVMSWSEIDPMAQQWADFADAYTWIVLAIVIIIVLVEVLNTMLMSLHERTREFGLMAALGIQRTQMFAMVVWETIILVAMGALLGFALGAGLSIWYGEQGIDLTRFAEAFSFMYMDPVVHPMLLPESCLRILGATLIGAILAGLIPASKVARLEPALALRSL